MEENPRQSASSASLDWFGEPVEEDDSDEDEEKEAEEKEAEAAEVTQGAPPESPRLGTLASPPGLFNAEPPPTPRLSRRTLQYPDPEDSDDDDDDIEPEKKSPSHRPRSRDGARSLTRSASSSRTLALALPFTSPSHKTLGLSDIHGTESEELPETRMRTRGGRSTAAAREPSTHSYASSSSSTLASSSPEPTYPTATTYAAIPAIQAKSQAMLDDLTARLLVAAQAGKWERHQVLDAAGASVEVRDHRDMFRHEIVTWEGLLDDIVEASPVPSPSPENRRPQQPRHGAASYAFTKLAVSKACEAHTRIYTRLFLAEAKLAATDRAEMEEVVREVRAENAKVWGHVRMAYDSDVANESSGTSWAFGETDWRRGVEQPEPVDWVGGKPPERVVVPAWSGRVPEAVGRR